MVYCVGAIILVNQKVVMTIKAIGREKNMGDGKNDFTFLMTR